MLMLPNLYMLAHVISSLQLMYNSLNALERTTRNFEKIVTGSGFKISRIYTTRGASSSTSF